MTYFCSLVLALCTAGMEIALTMASPTLRPGVPTTQRPIVSSNENRPDDVRGITPSQSVLQLNVIDRDGSLTSVVYPGKKIALELQSAPHGRYGVPMVTKCTVSNPFDSNKSDAGIAFSDTVISKGCGHGSVLSVDTGFSSSQTGYSTPFFIPPAQWLAQHSLLFACDVIICGDFSHCLQSCPSTGHNASTVGLYDVTVLLDSQIVTSCPHEDQAPDLKEWSQIYLPDCFPFNQAPDDHLAHPGANENLTAELTGESALAIDRTSPPGLAGQVHWVIIISVLGLMMVLFMLATFCKMVAMQRQLTRCNKMVAGMERATTVVDHQDQGTQTPTKPLPRTPNGRAPISTQKNHRSGDGIEIAALEVADNVSTKPDAYRSGQCLELNNPDYPPFPVPQTDKNRFHTRRQSYDVPPSHDGQAQMGMFVPSEVPKGLSRPHKPQRVPQGQVSATSQNNSEDHGTVTKANKQLPNSPESWMLAERLEAFNTSGRSTTNNSLPGKEVILTVNSPKKLVHGNHRSTNPEDGIINYRHDEVVTAQVFCNTPAPCSEESDIKEPYISCQDGDREQNKQLYGTLQTNNVSPLKSVQGEEGTASESSSACSYGREDSSVTIDLSPHSFLPQDAKPVTISSVEETTRL